MKDGIGVFVVPRQLEEVVAGPRGAVAVELEVEVAEVGDL